MTAPRGLWLPLGALGALIVLATLVVANLVYQQKRTDYWAVVWSVAELRSQQVSDWLEERLHSAGLHSTSFPQAELFTRWRVDGDEQARDLLYKRLGQFADSGRFRAVTLLDDQGRPLSGDSAAATSLPADLLARAIESADRASGASFIGPFKDDDGHVQMGFVATLPVDASLGRPVVWLHTHAEDYFPASMRSFPLPTGTGEVALFRVEDDAVVALADLQHLEDSAFARLAMGDAPDLLAVQLASASATDPSYIEGVDYRGKAVFGSGRPIPGTDWFLVAKMDTSEVAEAAFRTMVPIVLLNLLLFFAVTTMLVNRRQRRRLLESQAAQRAQGERLQALQLLKAVADSADDAIFVKDIQGRYLLFNRAASELTGKAEDEVLGQDDSGLFPPAQAKLLTELHRRVLAEDRAIMVRKTLDTVHGPRAILAKKGPLHDESGRLIGVYGISRDVTELERSSALLEEHGQDLEQRNRELERFNAAMVGREFDMLRLKQQVNDLSVRLGIEPPFGRQLIELPEED